MFGFIKKLFGTSTEVETAPVAPYKAEPAPVATPVVETQITDAVTQAPVPFPVPKPKAATEKKAVAKITPAKRGRKPKAK
jgi:hypothetical protein